MFVNLLSATVLLGLAFACTYGPPAPQADKYTVTPPLVIETRTGVKVR